MNQRKLSIAVLLADLVWTTIAMCVALALRYGILWQSLSKETRSHFLFFLAVTWLIWALFSVLLPLDGFRGGWQWSAVISQLLLAVGGLMLILLSGGYLAREYVSRLALVEFCALLFAGFVLIRGVVFLFLRVRSRNGWARRVVIIGRGRLARELARNIEKHPETLCKVVGFFTPDDGTAPSSPGLAGLGEPCKTGTLGVVDILEKQQTDQVILVLEESASPDLFRLASLCRAKDIKVSIVPQLYELYLSRSHFNDLGGIPVLQLARPGLSPPALVGKRVLDITAGAFIAVAAIPVILPLAVIVRRMKGRAFRWETRCGLHGKSFAMLRLNVDRTGNNQSRFEAVLRDLSLTELPQLWNVLRGEMSLVGPRPESRDRVCRYSEWEQQRLVVKPGMTGLAQVQGLREQHSSEEKTRFDLQYLLNCTLWSDLSLLVQTVWTLITRSIHQRRFMEQWRTETREDMTTQAQEELLENAHRS